MRHLEIRPDVTIPASDLVARAVRSSGPGGQNVNKVSSKVELRFDLPGTSALGADVKHRLRVLARGRLDADGWLMVVSQASRDRTHNLEDAREKLAELIARALVPPRPRRPTKPTAGSRERRLKDKQRRSRQKAERRDGE
jgi:ribosome-associated protein